MKKVIKPRLMPEYISKFSCIGSNCEDTCCVGWNVSIDKDTYELYQKSKDSELSQMFQKLIVKNDKLSTKLEYAHIKLNNDSSCPFLDSDKLCKIQKKCGHENLSKTCSTYPRITNLVNGVVETSMTLSCPEAARLALLNEDGIDFSQDEGGIDGKSIYFKSLDSNKASKDVAHFNYVSDLRFLSIAIIQNRKYDIFDRMLIVGLLTQRIETHLSNLSYSKITPEVDNFEKMLNDGEFKVYLENIPVNYSIQMTLLKEIIDKKITRRNINKRFLECFYEFLVGIDYKEKISIEEKQNNYINAYKNYYAPFMEKHNYILENYVVNYMFKSIYPLSKDDKIFDEFVIMAINFSIIKLLLIGMAAFHKGLTKELVVKLIQSYSKTFEHNNEFLERIKKMLDENGLNTLAYMSILIKN